MTQPTCGLTPRAGPFAAISTARSIARSIASPLSRWAVVLVIPVSLLLSSGVSGIARFRHPARTPNDACILPSGL